MLLAGRTPTPFGCSQVTQSAVARPGVRVPCINVVPTRPVPSPLAVVPIPDASAFPVVVRRGAATIVAAAPAEVVVADGPAGLEQLDRLEPGWWAGFLSYDLGRAVENVHRRHARDPHLPDLVLARYEARLVVDSSGPRLVGSRSARSALERLLERTPRPRVPTRLPAPTTSLDREGFETRVRSILELIRAGDCYQVNLTRRLEWDDPVDPLALHRALAVLNPAPHAALLVLPCHLGTVAVVSASPERFLGWSGAECETRPIKGTATDGEQLWSSTKDRAENVMIVDLARNDLGRACEHGSVEVPELFGIEEHPGLVHMVSTVRGRRRADVGPGALIRATFPPASVTGAPKPRVLQVIEDLEPVRRGIYCGAVGWVDTRADEGDLAVAIRTFTIAHGRTTLGIGSGIVADSDPTAEWYETELKATRLQHALTSLAGVAA
jgi:para-aminobenzoate synthetase component 1